MQRLPVEPETAACRPRALAAAKTRAASTEVTMASPTLPSWATLPPAHRRRLVAVLGDIVLRTRREDVDEP